MPNQPRTWFQSLMAEAAFLLLLVAATGSAWYDFSVEKEQYISTYVRYWINYDPAIAFLCGSVTVLIAWIIHMVWDIRFRYVLAILVLGFCFGHLFWSQSSLK